MASRRFTRHESLLIGSKQTPSPDTTATRQMTNC